MEMGYKKILYCGGGSFFFLHFFHFLHSPTVLISILRHWNYFNIKSPERYYIGENFKDLYLDYNIWVWLHTALRTAAPRYRASKIWHTSRQNMYYFSFHRYPQKVLFFFPKKEHHKIIKKCLNMWITQLQTEKNIRNNLKFQGHRMWTIAVKQTRFRLGDI